MIAIQTASKKTGYLYILYLANMYQTGIGFLIVSICLQIFKPFIKGIHGTVDRVLRGHWGEML